MICKLIGTAVLAAAAIALGAGAASAATGNGPVDPSVPSAYTWQPNPQANVCFAYFPEEGVLRGQVGQNTVRFDGNTNGESYAGFMAETDQGGASVMVMNLSATGVAGGTVAWDNQSGNVAYLGSTFSGDFVAGIAPMYPVG